MVGRFFGKDIMTKATCPFCGMPVQRPEPVPSREMPLGVCSCGAVYACDVTGHNLGSAMIEALVYACTGDWDCAWDLTPDEDYLDKQVKNYDFETHHIIHAGVYEGRRIAGVLYFIRLNKPVEVKTPPVQPDRPVSPIAGPASSGAPRRVSSKQEVENLIRSYDLNPLLEIAAQDKRILRDVKRLLYAAEKLFRWRAAEALGKISAVIATKDPGAISKLLQGLFTSVSDTAASSWGSVDAIGEIISALPDHFSGFLPQLVQISRDASLLPEVLRAMGKIAETRPDLLRRYSYPMIPLLRNPDSEVRGYAAILLGHLKAYEAKEDLMKLKQDKAPIDVYRAGQIERTTLHQLVAESLAKL
jgi:HEAT repeat protein